MRSFCTITLLLLLFLGTGGCQPKSSEKKKDDLKKVLEKGSSNLNAGTGSYVISGPAEWTQLDTMMNGVQATFVTSPQEDAADDFRENVNVVTEQLPAGVSLETYVEKSISMLQSQLRDFSKEKIEDVEINGMPAKSMRYAFTYELEQLSMQVFFLVSNNIGYVITCTARKGAFEKWEPDFKKIVGTFKLK